MLTCSLCVAASICLVCNPVWHNSQSICRLRYRSEPSFDGSGLCQPRAMHVTAVRLVVVGLYCHLLQLVVVTLILSDYVCCFGALLYWFCASSAFVLFITSLFIHWVVCYVIRFTKVFVLQQLHMVSSNCFRLQIEFNIWLVSLPQYQSTGPV